MSGIPYSKVVPIPELGPGASITLLNPWLLPVEKPVATELLQPSTLEPGAMRDAAEAARADRLNAEIEARMREKLRTMVLDWAGITDPLTGAPLPLPREDDNALERCPAVVRLKVRKAIEAMEMDMEWDPTRRRETPTPAPLSILKDGSSPS